MKEATPSLFDAPEKEIVPMAGLPLWGQIAALAVAPFALVAWVILLPVYVLWVATGVALASLTGRNWLLVLGDLPRLKR